MRDEQSLRLDTPGQHPFAELFVQDALVQRVLVDDLQAVGRFQHEITVVDLHGSRRCVGFRDRHDIPARRVRRGSVRFASRVDSPHLGIRRVQGGVIQGGNGGGVERDIVRAGTGELGGQAAWLAGGVARLGVVHFGAAPPTGGA